MLVPADLYRGRWYGGSGTSQALAIMEHGEEDPAKAIETVNRVCSSCGGDIFSYKFNGKRSAMDKFIHREGTVRSLGAHEF